MRTDHVHLIIGCQVAVGVLGPKDIEVIEPKIGHRLLKLAFAVRRANDLLRLQLLQQELRWPETIFLIVGHDLLPVFSLLILIRTLAGRLKVNALALLETELTREKLRRRILLLYLSQAHA